MTAPAPDETTATTPAPNAPAQATGDIAPAAAAPIAGTAGYGAPWGADGGSTTGGGTTDDSSVGGGGSFELLLSGGRVVRTGSDVSSGADVASPGSAGAGRMVGRAGDSPRDGASSSVVTADDSSVEFPVSTPEPEPLGHHSTTTAIRATAANAASPT